MAASDRIWQTTIWVEGERVVVYGASLSDLRREVVHELVRRESGSTEFANYHDVSKEGFHPWRRYLLLTAERLENAEVRAYLENMYGRLPDATEQPGWYVASPGEVRYYGQTASFLGSLAAVAEDFAQKAVVPEKGPDYYDPFAVADVLPLHRMKTIWRTKDAGRANDAIRRGWYLINLDAKGTLDERGCVQDRETVFVLGHPEEDAV